MKAQSIGNRLSAIGGVLLIAAAVSVLFWKCQFGIDLTDESFYLTPAWKLFSLGDKPFIDEIFNGPRHSDLLNYWFIRPLIPFSIYFIRLFAVFVYSIVLLSFTYVCFEGRVGLIAGLLFVGCLLFDWFVMPTWSYNWWCRNFFLLHHLFLFSAAHDNQSRRKSLKLFLAGMAVGFASVAYNTVFLSFLVMASVFGLLVRKGKWKQEWVPYVVGCLVVTGVDAAYVLSPHVRGDWLFSMQAISSFALYSSTSTFKKIGNIFGFFVFKKETWVLLGTLLVAAISLWNPTLRLRKLWLLPCVIALGLCVRWAFEMEQMLDYFHLYVSLALGGAVLLCIWAIRQKQNFFLIPILGSVTAAMIMGISSSNGMVSMIWMVPTILIPFVAILLQQTKRTRPKVQWLLVQWILVAVFCFLDLRFLRWQLSATYHDLPPRWCSATMRVPPLQGLRTSPRRAFLIDELRKVVDGQSLVLAFGYLPGAFLFSSARSSVDTIFVDMRAPLPLKRNSILRMGKRRRFPQLIVKTKMHPWTWGVVPQPVSYSAEDPYVRFADCARGKTLLNFEEYEVYRVDSNRVEECINRSIS